MSDRVWPAAGEGEVRVIRWPSMTGVAFVVPHHWDFQVSVPDAQDRIRWNFHRYEPEERERGGDIIWRCGRLVAAGPEAPRFYERIKDLGLTFGQIELELRLMTGYQDPIPGRN